MFKLQLATIKQIIRDKEALFWSLLFPALFMIIFSFFNVGGGVSAKVIVIDNAQNEQSKNVIATISNIDGVGINQGIKSLDEARSDLQNSQKLEFTYFDKEKNSTKTETERTNLIMLISKAEDGKNIDLKIFYDQAQESQASPSGILTSILRESSNERIIAEAGLKSPLNIERVGMSVNEVKYYDILVPGIIGMGIMQSGVIGMASTIATLKEKRVLKRLSATPLPIWKFLLANVVAHLLLSVVQVTIMLLLAKYLLGANIYGSIALLYLLSFIGNFVFLNLGFIAASFSKTARAAESLSQVFTTPMMFLSGVFFERDSLPQTVKVVADFLPLSPLLDAMRSVSLNSKGLGAISHEILIIALWTAVTFIFAARTFKFREE